MGVAFSTVSVALTHVQYKVPYFDMFSNEMNAQGVTLSPTPVRTQKCQSAPTVFDILLRVICCYVMLLGWRPLSSLARPLPANGRVIYWREIICRLLRGSWAGRRVITSMGLTNLSHLLTSCAIKTRVTQNPLIICSGTCFSYLLFALDIFWVIQDGTRLKAWFQNV